MKKIFSMFIAITLIIGVTTSLPTVSDQIEVNADVSQKVNVGVDFNGKDNRVECRYELFEDWIVEDTQEASYEYKEGGLNFTVKNASVNGAGYIGTYNSNKQLISASGSSPLLTLDGLRCSGFRNTAITLEIEGLPAGTHTLTSWHSVFWAAYKNVSLSVTINGEPVNSGLTIPCKVTDDDQAAITYNSFEAVEGEPVVITFSTENKGSNNVMVLNAFEIDGVHPLKSIKDPVPAVNEGHHDPELGLSWTAAAEAVSHDVYLGTDKYMVQNATKDSDEYKGNFTECAYSFEEELDHMSTYYWRVDEVLADGEVCTGKVMQFEVRHLAFPSAEGYGRFAKGGRGGRVIEVTTLEDGYEDITLEDGTIEKRPIAGSLRYALEYEKGARIVVFRVGGVIQLTGQLCIPADGGNVYVAGQTAPGDGITLINHDFGAMGAEDIIIRNVRVRVGDMNGSSTGGMGMASCSDCIIDHCSIAWATDEGFSSRSAKNLTFQYNIIGESLHDSVHYIPGPNGERPEGTSTHAFAATIGGDIGSFHHNLLINCTDRNWSLQGNTGSDGKTYIGKLDISNNVVYNWRGRTTDGGTRRTNFVNNFYKMGHESRDMYIINLSDQLTDYDVMKAYVSGNIMQKLDGTYSLSPEDDAWELGKATGAPTGEYTLADMRSDEPFFPHCITLETAEDAYNTVLANAGANYPERDYIDSRYITEVSTGTYTYKGSKQGLLGIIDSQEDAGGYPNEETFEHAVTPEDFDTDHDGMEDAWEIKHGLNPEDPADGAVFTLSNEGYTNVELYLNELMGDEVVYANEDEKPTPTATPVPTVPPTEVPTATPEVTEIPYTLGDVNGDGNINAQDALAVLKHAAKIAELDEIQQMAADVVADENINAQDALQILKKAAQIIDSF